MALKEIDLGNVRGPAGPTGAKGVSMRLKGAWSSSITYVNDGAYIDLVTSGGNTYACKKSHANQAVSNTTYWELIAQKGATGPQGKPGLTDAEKKLIQEWEKFKTSGGEISGNLSAIQLATKSPSNNYRWAEETHNTGYKIISSNTNPSTGDWREEFIMAHDGFAPKNGKVLGTSENPWNDIFIKGVSKNTNGYTKLPNGMIIQWGYGSLNARTTFPIAFHSAALSVIASADNTQAVYISCKDVITTSFVTVASQNGGFRWIAIGY